MKIRNGFVSNSSSSSFIADIPDDFKITIEDVRHPIIIEQYEDYCEEVRVNKDSRGHGEYVPEKFNDDDLMQKVVDRFNNEHLTHLREYGSICWDNMGHEILALVQILRNRNHLIMEVAGDSSSMNDVLYQLKDERFNKPEENKENA